MVSRGHSYRNYNWQRSLDIVDQFMAGYGLPEKKKNKTLEPVID